MSAPPRVQSEFLSEAEEIAERLGADLETLADRRADGREPPPELVNRLFRSAHTLKGLARSVGVDAIAALAHAMEDVLDALRMGRVGPDAPAVHRLDEALAMLVSALRGLSEEGGEESVTTHAVDELRARIAADLAAPVRAHAADPLDALDLDASVRGALTQYEEHRLRESLRRGRRIARVHVRFGLAHLEEGLGGVRRRLGDDCELISTLPSSEACAEDELSFALLVASELEPEALAERLAVDPAAVTSLELAAPRVETEESEPRAVASEEGDSLRSISDTVRVDIRKLDELMNLVGELLIQRVEIAELASRLLGAPETARAGTWLAKVHKRLDRKLQQLQSSALELRMVPLQQVFEKLSRAGRRLARDLGKRVRLELRGAETELDKLIVEDLVDPLMHLVRNAFDHAIEPAADRVAAGKPEEGVVRIAASQRGSHVVIDVADDGRGIDPARVRARAEARGLVAPRAPLGPRELFDLLFLPGFSTREEVTETSGRGVGLDVVRANVTALGGRVELDSKPGEGTRISLTLPITLAIIQVLVVGVGDQHFAVPLTAVLETLRVERARIQRSEGRELLSLRGEPLPLRDLAREFDLAGAGGEERCFVLVLGLGEARVGVIVDRVEGQQDAVVKPIQGPIPALRGVTGATELGSRGAVLVLDVAALVEDPLRRREAA